MSNSSVSPLTATTGTTPDFSISVAPASLTLKQGQSGSAVVSVTPINAASLTGPMFAPDCPTSPVAPLLRRTSRSPWALPPPFPARWVLATQAASLTKLENREAHPVDWAVMFPGVLALGGLAFGVRRSRFPQPHHSGGPRGIRDHARRHWLCAALQLSQSRAVSKSAYAGRYVHCDHHRTIQHTE